MPTQTIRKILTRDFILGFISEFTFSIAYHVLYPTLPIYLSRFGSTEVDIGVLIGILGVSSLVFRPFIGRALLKTPEKNFMIGGAILFAFTFVAYLFCPPFLAPFHCEGLSRNWSGLLIQPHLHLSPISAQAPIGDKPSVTIYWPSIFL